MKGFLTTRQLAASAASVLAGLAIGWLAGAGRDEGQESEGGSNKVSLAKGKEQRHQGSGTDAGPRRDFAAYLKRVERQANDSGLEQAVARMSREELRELLLETPEDEKSPGWKFDIAKQLREKVTAAAAAELLRRDGVGAMEWIEASGRKNAWAAMLRALVMADPAAAKEREQAFDGGAMRYAALRLSYPALQGAAARSAKDVIECLKLGYADSFEFIPEYAPGFDFGAVAAYLESLEQRSFGDSAKHLVGRWAAADPEAAAAAMIKGMQDPERDWSQTFAPALASRASLVGEDAAAAWLAGLLKQVPEERREGIVASLIDHELTTARAAGLIAHLEDRDRIALAVTSEDVYAWKSEQRPTVRLIQAMPTEELQMQALQAIAGRTVRDRPAAARAGNLKQLESLMVKLQLSEAAMQKVFESAGGE